MNLFTNASQIITFSNLIKKEYLAIIFSLVTFILIKKENAISKKKLNVNESSRAHSISYLYFGYLSSSFFEEIFGYLSR